MEQIFFVVAVVIGMIVFLGMVCTVLFDENGDYKF